MPDYRASGSRSLEIGRCRSGYSWAIRQKDDERIPCGEWLCPFPVFSLFPSPFSPWEVRSVSLLPSGGGQAVRSPPPGGPIAPVRPQVVSRERQVRMESGSPLPQETEMTISPPAVRSRILLRVSPQWGGRKDLPPEVSHLSSG